MFDLAVPFFLPVWRRVATVGFALGWGVFEVASGAPFWGMIFLGMGGIAAWKFWTADWAAVASAEKDS